MTGRVLNPHNLHAQIPSRCNSQGGLKSWLRRILKIQESRLRPGHLWIWCESVRIRMTRNEDIVNG